MLSRRLLLLLLLRWVVVGGGGGGGVETSRAWTGDAVRARRGAGGREGVLGIRCVAAMSDSESVVSVSGSALPAVTADTSSLEGPFTLGALGKDKSATDCGITEIAVGVSD